MPTISPAQPLMTKPACRTAIAAAVLWFATCTSIWAQYLPSASAVSAESRIVGDLQAGRLDPANLAPGVEEKIFQLINGSPPLLKGILSSPLKKVCPVLSVKNAYGRQYAFRSIHEMGKLDWIVTVPDTSPETIGIISLLPPSGRAPAVLPIITTDQKSITSSVEMGCSSEAERKAAEDDIREADDKFGKIFQDGSK
jgi:hypothetical protein